MGGGPVPRLHQPDHRHVVSRPGRAIHSSPDCLLIVNQYPTAAAAVHSYLTNSTGARAKPWCLLKRVDPSLSRGLERKPGASLHIQKRLTLTGDRAKPGASLYTWTFHSLSANSQVERVKGPATWTPSIPTRRHRGRGLAEGMGTAEAGVGMTTTERWWCTSGARPR
jgi:hypothetical protein